LAEAVLDSLSAIDRYVRLMAVVPSIEAIASVLNTYLTSWSEERVERLQAIDGGWGPFDERQRPMPIYGAGDIFFLARTVREHCKAVRAAGIDVTSDLLELDLMLRFAAESTAVHDWRSLAMEYA